MDRSVIVVGVQETLPDAVLLEAARLAGDLHARLVCAHVDLSRYTIGEHLDGSVMTRSIDPDLPEEGVPGFPSALTARIDELLADTGVEWEGRELAGDPGHALGRLAEILDARMIVVGTRQPGVRETMRQFFQGSVANHLAHRQHRPVLVVPLAPAADGEPLPWE